MNLIFGENTGLSFPHWCITSVVGHAHLKFDTNAALRTPFKMQSPSVVNIQTGTNSAANHTGTFCDAEHLAVSAWTAKSYKRIWGLMGALNSDEDD